MDIVLLSLRPEDPLDGADGHSSQFRALAAALARGGHRVWAVARGGGSPVREVADGVGHVEVGSDRLDAVSEAIAARRPELVIESLSAPRDAGVLAARAAGIPHIYLVDHPRAFGTAPAADMSHAFGASQGAIAFTGEAASWVREHAPRHFPVRLTNCGVDPALLAGPAAQAVTRARARLGRRPGWRVGFAGALTAAHDLETLAWSVGRMRRQGPVQLVLLGDGPLRNPLVRLAVESDFTVAAMGPVPHEEVAAYLSQCDVVTAPCADAEGCASPTRLIEAMAVGRPLVASATRLARHHVRDGHDGLLAPVGDRDAFAAHLVRLASDAGLRERLGANAAQSARRRRTWDSVAGDILDFGLACAERLAG